MTHPNRTIGIDISDHIIRAVVLRTGGSRKRMLHYAEAPLEDGTVRNGVIQEPDRMEYVVKKLIKKGIPARSATTVVGLPESHGFIKTITFQKEDEKSVQKEIEKHLPFPYEEVIIDTIEGDGFLSFAAIKKEVAQMYLDLLCPLGFHIRALEIESQAIARLFASVPEDDNINQAIILGDIGRNHTTFLVVRNGLIEFTHTSKLISGRILNDRIMQQFQVTPEKAERIKIEQQQHPQMQAIIQEHTQALANELQRVVNFHSLHPIGGPTEQYIVYLIGSGSQIQNLRQYLEAKIYFPVQQAKFRVPMHLPKKIHSQILSYGTAIGLAIRGYEPL